MLDLGLKSVNCYLLSEYLKGFFACHDHNVQHSGKLLDERESWMDIILILTLHDPIV